MQRKVERERMKSCESKTQKACYISAWERVSPEILALIFVRMPADHLVRSVTLVCKAWLAAIAGPYCWTEIDVEQWCRKCASSDLVDSAVRKLVRRSRCTFQRLSAYRLGNSGFSFVANCGRCLKVLQIPMSQITDEMVVRHAESLSNLTVLDISYCLKITSKALEAFGNQCKSLVHLKRNMPPPEWRIPASSASAGWAHFATDESEAWTIADTMSGLEKLELCFGQFRDFGLGCILDSCRLLTHLNIQGCWNVNLDGDLKMKCEALMSFTDPWVEVYDDDVESSEGDGTEEYSSESE